MASGVQFPRDAANKRSTTGPAKAIWRQAFASVDSEAAARLEAEPNWRKRYADHVAPLTRASAKTPELTLQSVKDGLSAVHATFDFVRDGNELKLADAMNQFTEVPRTGRVDSDGTRQVNDAEAVSVRIGSQSFSGAALRKLMADKVAAGEAEPDVAAAYEEITSGVMSNWRASLQDTYFVLLGATSELCPLQTLLGLGLNVVAIARPNAKRQQRLLDMARAAPAGASLTVPILSSTPGAAELDDAALSDPAQVARVCGADMIESTPEVANWLAQLMPGKRLVIGSYIYLDGADHVRASVAMDAVLARVLQARPDTALAYLGTPAVVYPIAAAAWKDSRRRLKDDRRWWHAAAGALLGPYTPNVEDPVVADSVNAAAADQSREIYMYNGVSNVQGPNYLLAKTLQNWRAVLARAQGTLVSVNMTPVCRTESVMHVATVARAVRGITAFPPLTSYEPQTAEAIMGLLLIFDLCSQKSEARPDFPLRNPMDIFASLGVHSGVWRSAYSQDSIGKTAYVADLLKLN